MTRSGQRIRVCAWVPYPPGTTPSQRYRLEQWMPLLDSAGISVDLFPFVDQELMKLLHKPRHRMAKAMSGLAAFARRFAQVKAAAGYDAVLIHRGACIAGPAIVERILSWMGVRVIFDFDDAIYLLHTTEANRGLGLLKFPGKTAAICRLSDRVVVGNAYLARYALQFNSRVTVVPTSVDTDKYRPALRTDSSRRLIIGWTGSSTSQTYLEAFAPVLRELVGLGEVELRVHSDREPVLPGIPFVWRPWTPETETGEIAQFDIGIMPMPDDPWARGKCAMKALIYMAMGIPAVCSAVGTNCEVIQHGENGLLASTPEEWNTCLGALLDDRALRERLGRAGRRTVEERYAMTVSAGLFAQVIRESAGRAPAGRRRTGPDFDPGVQTHPDGVESGAEQRNSAI